MLNAWPTRGVVLTAPLHEDIDDVVRFIDEFLAPRGCNLIVMQIRYRYQFRRHPECQGYDPLSYDDVQRLRDACRRSSIRLVPKMNLHGHQSGLPNTPTDGILHGHSDVRRDIRDGLLRAYPELDELYGEAGVLYSRSLCTTNPLTRLIVFDLIDEILEAFGADAIHVGCDEVFHIGCCDECSKHSHDELLGDWLNALHGHISSKGARMMMWGDRLIGCEETGYHEYEASNNGTWQARDRIARDILVCDWHYEKLDAYPSIDIFAREGFKILLSPWRSREAADSLIDYARRHDRGHIEGILATTWCGSGDLARCILDGEPPRWLHTAEVASQLKRLFC